MTFVKEEKLKKKNKLIEEYLNNRKLLKKRLQNEIQSKQKLQESASEIFLPITKKIEKPRRKQMKGKTNKLKNYKKKGQVIL